MLLTLAPPLKPLLLFNHHNNERQDLHCSQTRVLQFHGHFSKTVSPKTTPCSLLWDYRQEIGNAWIERTNLNCLIVMKALTLGRDGKSPTSVYEGSLGSTELKMLSDCVKLKLLLSVNCCACAIGFHEIKRPSGRVDGSFPDSWTKLEWRKLGCVLHFPRL